MENYKWMAIISSATALITGCAHPLQVQDEVTEERDLSMSAHKIVVPQTQDGSPLHDWSQAVEVGFPEEDPALSDERFAVEDREIDEEGSGHVVFRHERLGSEDAGGSLHYHFDVEQEDQGDYYELLVEPNKVEEIEHSALITIGALSPNAPDVQEEKLEETFREARFGKRPLKRVVAPELAFVEDERKWNQFREHLDENLEAQGYLEEAIANQVPLLPDMVGQTQVGLFEYEEKNHTSSVRAFGVMRGEEVDWSELENRTSDDQVANLRAAVDVRVDYPDAVLMAISQTVEIDPQTETGGDVTVVDYNTGAEEARDWFDAMVREAFDHPN